MRLRSFALLAAAVVLSACAEPAPPTPPKLVVMVSIDQLRGDLLDRYDAAFTGGFRRLIDGGMYWDQASHRHASTSTGIGHTTISTGVYPTRHGIVGNSWNEAQADGSLRSVYAVQDDLSPIVGFPNAPGRSPQNIFRTGLADWMQAQDGRTRVLSVSSKDRGAIPMAGQAEGHVYWLMSPAGRFATSTYYRRDYPNWVEIFNRERMPEILGDTIWDYRVDPAHDALTRPDEADYEGDGENTTFPHVRTIEAPGASPAAQYGWAYRTPMGDLATLEFTLEAMQRIGLGQQDQQDFLAVSFSATDYVGHGYGPLSREQLDNLVRLDELLGRLMDALDAQVGEGNWVLGLSADHGVVTMPEWLAEQGQPGYRTQSNDITEMQIAVDSVERAMEGAPIEEVHAEIAVALERMDWIADVILPSELEGPSADSMVSLFANSFNVERRWSLLPQQGLYVRATEGTYVTGSPTGTGHGSVYWYDRWVPMVFYGAGVTAGRTSAEAYTVDLAPTLAELAGIEAPSDLDGVSRAN